MSLLLPLHSWNSPVFAEPLPSSGLVPVLACCGPVWSSLLWTRLVLVSVSFRYVSNWTGPAWACPGPVLVGPPGLSVWLGLVWDPWPALALSCYPRPAWVRPEPVTGLSGCPDLPGPVQSPSLACRAVTDLPGPVLGPSLACRAVTDLPGPVLGPSLACRTVTDLPGPVLDPSLTCRSATAPSLLESTSLLAPLRSVSAIPTM